MACVRCRTRGTTCMRYRLIKQLAPLAGPALNLLPACPPARLQYYKNFPEFKARSADLLGRAKTLLASLPVRRPPAGPALRSLRSLAARRPSSRAWVGVSQGWCWRWRGRLADIFTRARAKLSAGRLCTRRGGSGSGCGERP